MIITIFHRLVQKIVPHAFYLCPNRSVIILTLLSSHYNYTQEYIWSQSGWGLAGARTFLWVHLTPILKKEHTVRGEVRLSLRKSYPTCIFYTNHRVGKKSSVYASWIYLLGNSETDSSVSKKKRQKLHLTPFFGDCPARICPSANKMNSINTISCFLTPAEIPISILPTVGLILARSTNDAVMIVCFNW